MTAPGPLRILLVEDSTTQARFFEQALSTIEPMPPEVVWVDSLGGALGRPTDSIDLVLLDLVLPDSAGIETFRAVRDAHQEVPIIVLSGTGNDALAHQAVAEGAQDYLFKGTVSPDVLIRAIGYAMERHRRLTDLQNAALIDGMTGVYNRRGFGVLAEQQFTVARRAKATATVLFVDVDGLKQVNDSFDHKAGDLLLCDLADLMKATFRSSDIIGRVGGDEFGVMLITNDNTTVPKFKLQAAIQAYNRNGLREFHLKCSIGTASGSAQDSMLTDLLERADRAMYVEKQARRLTAVPAC